MGIASDYVDNYSDLTQAYNNDVTTNKNWGAYVWTGGNSTWDPNRGPCPYRGPGNACWTDLEYFWNTNQNYDGRGRVQSLYNSKEAWGQAHYEKYGSREGRQVPFRAFDTIAWDKDQWGARHWQLYGHTEARALPGAKYSYNPETKQLYVAREDLIGDGLKSNFRDIATAFNNSEGGNFKALMENIPSVLGNNSGNFAGIVNDLNLFNSVYALNKVQRWDPAWGADPPTGGFDANYYLNNYAGVSNEWQSALDGVNVNGYKFNNLDITERYGTLDNYLKQHYTNVGRYQNYRGNAAEDASRATGYSETLTDAEKQLYRDQVLGITGAPGQEAIQLTTPQYDEQGNLINANELNTILEQEIGNVLSGDDARKEAQLGALAQDVLKTTIDELRVAKQKEANISFLNQLPGYSEIMNINSTLANSIIGDSGIGGVLGITGGSKDYQKSLEGEISKLTGVSSNSTLYNWQKWFDETLLKRYDNYQYEVKQYSDAELTTLQEQAQQEVRAYQDAVAKGEQPEKPVYLQVIEQQAAQGKQLSLTDLNQFKEIMFNVDLNAQKQFMTSFINDYIKPRFAQSKSIDEFISYLDVKENEQNVFQSQTTVNKLKEIAQLRAKSFRDLMQLSERTAKAFNADFYFDPVANNTKPISADKQAQYALQRDIVANDFENAKNNVTGTDGINWAIEAYRYGYENTYKTDPSVFAKLHYQVKGGTGGVRDAQGNPFIFDPAEDILPYEELDQKIRAFGADMVARKEFYGDASFMQFVTPEEYADALLKSVSPEQNKEEWDKIVKSLGLDTETAGVEEVKQYLIDSLRTEQARQIRESIKYLNETQQDLTQKNLGISYIERPEDKKTITEGQTVLYTIFKNAGYGGTEDEFYADFMPDVNRSDQQLITKAASDKGITIDSLNLQDPLAAVTSISNLFGEDTTDTTDGSTAQTSQQDTSKTDKELSYFKLFGDDTTEEDYSQKSKAAESFLGEFTSMFSGFG